MSYHAHEAHDFTLAVAIQATDAPECLRNIFGKKNLDLKEEPGLKSEVKKPHCFAGIHARSPPAMKKKLTASCLMQSCPLSEMLLEQRVKLTEERSKLSCWSLPLSVAPTVSSSLPCCQPRKTSRAIAAPHLQWTGSLDRLESKAVGAEQKAISLQFLLVPTSGRWPRAVCLRVYHS